MLYVIVKYGAAFPELYIPWHIGESIEIDDINNVSEIQADGAELEWIRENIIGIPFWKADSSTRMRVLNWYGDHAKFIANCLPASHWELK